MLKWRTMSQEHWEALVRQADTGGEHAKERLFTALYRELHELAERQLRRSSAPLSATTLLHETYLALRGGQAEFPDEARFMGYAARAMRGLIIDFARQHRAQKRGGEFHITPLDTQVIEQLPEQRELEHLSEAISDLASRDPRLAELVDLRYFCGFSLVEIARLRGVSERTVQRDWEKARLLLYREITEDGA